MSISSSIANALTGLRATGSLSDTASNNLANALTKGYGRQEVSLGSAILEGTGVGVRVVSVSRASSPNITAARREADGEAATLEPQAKALESLARALGEATDSEGLGRRIETFENTLRAFAETPESTQRQTQAALAAQDVATFLNGLSDQAATVRQNADAEIDTLVKTVNTNVERVDSLNAKIVALSVGGSNVAALVDERERLIDEINAIIPVRPHTQSNGSVHLTTAQGMFLLAEDAVPLNFLPSPIITPGMIYDPAGGGALSGLTLASIDITPTGTHGQRPTQGALAGEFLVRDTIGKTFNDQIDQFAADLISRFQDPAVDPTLGATDPGLFTDAGGILDPTTIDGLADRIALNPLVAPSAGGDPARLRDGLLSAGPGPVASDAIPRALIDAMTALRPAAAIPGVGGTLSAFQMITGITESLGIDRTTAQRNLAANTATREALAINEADAIGVDTDEELQDLILIEQAFAANLQVIQAASRMLQEITEIR